MEEKRHCFKDLLKHKLGLQKNKHTEIWTRISNTFYKHFDSNPKNVLEEGNFDAKGFTAIANMVYFK